MGRICRTSGSELSILPILHVLVQMALMYAARLHGPNDIRYEQVPDPIPGPGQILVRVHAAGICGTDLELHSHEHPVYKSGKGALPLILGHEWSGEVVEVGRGVTRFKPSDRVTCENPIGCGACEACLSGHENVCPNRMEFGIQGRDGAFAEYTLSDEGKTHSIRRLGFDEAALLEPATVAVRAVRRAEIKPGDRVAVLGSGCIGLLVVQAARAAGADLLLAADIAEPKRELARRLGANLSIDPSARSLPDACRELTGGSGFNAVIECSGSMKSLADAFRLAAIAGRVVIVGVYGGASVPILPDALVSGEITVRGTVGGQDCWDEAIRLVSEGVIKTSPLISHILPLSDVREAFELAGSGNPDLTKIVMKPPIPHRGIQ
jgi:2-desacetyl-2-hydroxyethyl bacteriochlorophyllide A dehydrogenase